MRAASMASVPDPHMGSRKGLSPDHPLAMTIPAIVSNHQDLAPLAEELSADEPGTVSFDAKVVGARFEAEVGQPGE